MSSGGQPQPPRRRLVRALRQPKEAPRPGGAERDPRHRRAHDRGDQVAGTHVRLQGQHRVVLPQRRSTSRSCHRGASTDDPAGLLEERESSRSAKFTSPEGPWLPNASRSRPHRVVDGRQGPMKRTIKPDPGDTASAVAAMRSRVARIPASISAVRSFIPNTKLASRSPTFGMGRASFVGLPQPCVPAPRAPSLCTGTRRSSRPHGGRIPGRRRPTRVDRKPRAP
jgi:hypothetical protein